MFDLVDLSEALEALLGVHVDVVSQGSVDWRHRQILEQARAL